MKINLPARELADFLQFLRVQRDVQFFSFDQTNLPDSEL
jgi:hypothetical protein